MLELPFLFNSKVYVRVEADEVYLERVLLSQEYRLGPVLVRHVANLIVGVSLDVLVGRSQSPTGCFGQSTFVNL